MAGHTQEGMTPMAADHLRDVRRNRRRVLLAAVLPLAAALAACEMSVGNLIGRATDEWTHTYPLANGGQLEIINTNGRIDIEGVDGTTVEVRAERIARAATDAGAKELLPRIVIKEDARPDRVTIETQRMGGIMFGANFEVRYHVRAPRHAVIRVTNTNGVVAATALTGSLFAHTTNGGVTAKEISGAIDAQTTNGGVSVDVASLSDSVTLKTTNGAVALSLPEDAKADISANCTNGGISMSGLKMEMTDTSRRHVQGTLNGGGARVDLRTTNGGIRVRAREKLKLETENLRPET
jgi:putative adhesin